MNNLHFIPLDPKELAALTPVEIQEIANLAKIYRVQDRIRNIETIAIALNNNQLDISVTTWDSAYIYSFLMMSFSLHRDDLLQVANSDIQYQGYSFESLKTRSIWLASVALLHESIVEKVKVQGIGLWIMTMLYSGISIEDPQKTLEEILDDCKSYGISTEALSDQIKMQLVIFWANKIKKGIESNIPFEIARNWCSHLLLQPETKKMMFWAANVLQVEIPTANKNVSPDSESSNNSFLLEVKKELQDPEVSNQGSIMPEIWPIPSKISYEGLLNEYDRIVIDLKNCSSLANNVFSHINNLSRGTNIDTVGRTLLNACRDLWRKYWTEGDRSILPLLRSIVILMLSIKYLKDMESRKGQILNLYLNTLLPDLIYTCDLDDLLNDAPLLASHLGMQYSKVMLLAGIVQAHAGESLWLSQSSNFQKKDALLKDNHVTLEKFHNFYREYTGNNDKDDEAPAWYLLFPSESNNNIGNIQKVSGVSFPGTSQAPIQTILADQAFRRVMRLGSHEQTRDYASNNIEYILDLLRRRLDVRIGSDFVMKPEGIVYQPNAAKIRQPHAEFIAAQINLEQNNYDSAQRGFERLIGRVSGPGADIARNYLAYALAKQGDPVNARSELRRLYESKSTYSSVYWNYACCLPGEEIEKKLEAFYFGLEYAPHPKLLHGAIYLASLSNYSEDNRLKEWLPALTYSEALLWLYLIEYDQHDFDFRDAMFLRLGQYVRKGEPIIPNPLDREIPGEQLENLVPSLIERNQSKAIEFWLRCRERIARDRFDYWELRTDYLEQSSKKKEAIESFIEELSIRLRFMTSRLEKKQKYPKSIIPSTSRRVDHWLRLCMTDEFRGYGQRMIDDISQFEEKIKKVITLLPKDRSIRNYYKNSTEKVGTKLPQSPNLTNTSKSNVKPTGPEPYDYDMNLDTLLARTGATCKARLHELKHLPTLRPDLDRLIQVFRTHGAHTTASTLLNLVEEWACDWPRKKKDDREQSKDKVKALVAEFQLNIQKELNANYYELALPLIEVFKRLNDHVARFAGLLPTLEVSPIQGESCLVDLTNGISSFSLRLTCQSGNPAVRLKNAEASLQTKGVYFSSRDRFSDLEITLSPEHPVLLTFEANPKADLDISQVGTLVVTYDYSGSEYVSQPMSFNLKSYTCPTLPEESPYRYGRSLQADEIEKLFVGRDDEQQQILQSISNGQQVVRYVEGIRRVGKSSLLRSIEYKIKKLRLPLIPIVLAPDSANEPGLLLFNLLNEISHHPEVAPYKLSEIEEERCKSNPTAVYDSFLKELHEKMLNHRVVALLDDFQELVIAASIVREKDPLLANGFRNILNRIRQQATPDSRLLWVFAGQIAREQYRKMLPNVLFWGDMISLHIAFLDKDSIGEILRRPLMTTSIIVPDETVEHLHFLTAGHPELSQQMADLMFSRAVSERRTVFTPADATEAAFDLAESQDNFADTWYPQSELSEVQKEFVSSFLHSVPLGGRIEPFKLSPNNQLTDAQKIAIDDLVMRRILDADSDGRYGIKAYVLELWLRRVLPRLATENLAFNGSAAIFIDIANLTNGKGDTFIIGLETAKGEGNPGRFSLKTILALIEKYSSRLSPAPVATRYAVNYPKGSPAVVECNAQGYYIENIPEALWTKGSDDHTLVNKISDVEHGYPMVTHFVLVAGDKDYRIKIESLLKKGKHVHVLSRARNLSRPETEYSYDFLAKEYPSRFTVQRIETLIEELNID